MTEQKSRPPIFRVESNLNPIISVRFKDFDRLPGKWKDYQHPVRSSIEELWPGIIGSLDEEAHALLLTPEKIGEEGDIAALFITTQPPSEFFLVKSFGDPTLDDFFDDIYVFDLFSKHFIKQQDTVKVGIKKYPATEGQHLNSRINIFGQYIYMHTDKIVPDFSRSDIASSYGLQGRISDTSFTSFDIDVHTSVNLLFCVFSENLEVALARKFETKSKKYPKEHCQFFVVPSASYTSSS